MGENAAICRAQEPKIRNFGRWRQQMLILLNADHSSPKSLVVGRAVA
jgi:hypothetical protein